MKKKMLLRGVVWLFVCSIIWGLSASVLAVKADLTEQETAQSDLTEISQPGVTVTDADISAEEKNAAEDRETAAETDDSGTRAREALTPAVFLINEYVFNEPSDPADPKTLHLNLPKEAGSQLQTVKTNFSWKAEGVEGQSGSLPAGSVKIELPTLIVPRDRVKKGLYSWYASYAESFGKFFVKTADQQDDSLFEVTVDEAGNVALTNQQPIAAGMTGTFDVSYTVMPRMYYSGYDMSTELSITTNGVVKKQPGLNLKMKLDNDEYVVTKTHKPYKPADADPDYFWTLYTIELKRTGQYGVGDDAFAFIDQLDFHKGQIVGVSLDGNPIEFHQRQDNERLYQWSYRPTDEQLVLDARGHHHPRLTFRVIVKYGKNDTVNVWQGGFEGMINYIFAYAYEWKKAGPGAYRLFSGSVAHTFDGYDFKYWEGIDLKKLTATERSYHDGKNRDTVSRTFMSTQDGAKFTYHIGALNSWDRTEPYDLEICDDLMDIKNKDGSFVQLTDDEYRFKTLRIDPSSIKNPDASPLNTTYDYEIYLRSAGSREYTLYRSFSTADGSQRLILPEGTVGFKFRLKNEDRPLDLGNDKADLITVEGAVLMDTERAAQVMATANPAVNPEEAVLRNLTYLELFEPAGDVIPFGLTADNYTGISGPANAARDLEKYGRYMFRRKGDVIVVEDILPEFVFKNISADAVRIDENGDTRFSSGEPNLKNSPADDAFIGYVQLAARYIDYYSMAMPIKGVTFYDLLPAGMEWNTDDSLDDLRFISLNRNNLGFSVIQADGSLTEVPAEQIETYLKEHAAVTVTSNYRNSGRDKVSVAIDFEGDRIFSKDNELEFGVSFPVKVSYQNRFLHGDKYQNSAVILTKDVPSGAVRIGNVRADNGAYLGLNDSHALWADINENGDTDELIAWTSRSLTLPEPATSEQKPEKFVENRDSQFCKLPDVAEVIEGRSFKYQLKVTAKGGYLADLILYDVLPQLGDSYFDLDRERHTEWEPEFERVDLDLLREQGIDPKVYYSSEAKPPMLLLADGSVNPVWREDKPQDMRSIAIDLRKGIDGSDYILDYGRTIVAGLIMKAPEDREEWDGKIAHNTFYYEKNAWNPKEQKRIGSLLPSESNDTHIRYLLNQTDVSVTKIWENLPADLTSFPAAKLILYQDGMVWGEPVVLTSIGNGSQTAKWQNLPKFKPDGSEHRYAVREEEIPDGYERIVSDDGLTITNRYIDPTQPSEPSGTTVPSEPTETAEATAPSEPTETTAPSSVPAESDAPIASTEVIQSSSAVMPIHSAETEITAGSASQLPKTGEEASGIKYTAIAFLAAAIAVYGLKKYVLKIQNQRGA